MRWLISALALGAWLTVSHKLPVAGALLRCEGLTVAGVAVTGITLFYALENLSLRFTSVTNAGILANLTGVFMALIATIWLHERLALSGWLAMLVAFLGAALVSQGAGHFGLASGGLIGDLMMIVATLFGAIYSIGSKGLVSRYPADVVTTLVAALGALFLLPLAIWEGFTLVLPASVWGALLVLGLGAGALANLWWLHILSRMPAARAGMILFLVPVTSTLLAVTALHEPFTPAMLVGGLLVTGSVAVMQRQPSEQPAMEPARSKSGCCPGLPDYV